MATLSEKILSIDKTICRYLDQAELSERGIVSQDIIAHLIAFVEHIMLNFYSKNTDILDTTENIEKGIVNAQVTSELKELYRFHKYLNIVAIHYSLDEGNSERLMLKYYKYLLNMKNLVEKYWNMEILHNLDKFPLKTNTELEEYHRKIAEKIEMFPADFSAKGAKYYIQKKKPIIIGKRTYYEVTFVPALGHTNKSHRVIAFTKLPVMSNYASMFEIKETTIEILGKIMPITLIVGWQIAIRDCEYKHFSYILTGREYLPDYTERIQICGFLTRNQYSLSDLMDFPDVEYNLIISEWKSKARTDIFIKQLEICRNIIRNSKPGQNLLRYLLFIMNNEVIKAQKGDKPNYKLSYLYFDFGSIPFDKMPFISSPKQHNPRLRTLFSCIPTYNREHELLARKLKNNSEIQGHIFSTLDELSSYSDLEMLKNKYNSILYPSHIEKSKIVIEENQIYLNEYKTDTCTVIRKLLEMSHFGVEGYTESMDFKIDFGFIDVDCDEKKKILLKMFSESRVAMVYGSAGVGKTTLIKHVSKYFSDKNILFLTQTNSAKNNLEMRMKNESHNHSFSTISGFINETTWVNSDCELLVIDESSTVSNSDMVKVLNKVNCNLMLLVGDIYQISSIRFGNWFTAARNFLPEASIFELKTPYRAKDNIQLLQLWEKVRNMSDDVQEEIALQSCSLKVDKSLLSEVKKDEVILCLNYDGLYGINNINRFLQESNPNPRVKWGVQYYKVGDPIIFWETQRFGGVIYNNMKGTIVGINILDKDTTNARIQFNIALSEEIDDDEFIWCSDVTLSGNTEEGYPIIRFSVHKTKSYDEDNSSTASRTVVPFQVAYAVSIHKSQGLEYDTVKVVITDEVDEMVTHNIFYTAITRAKNCLKIYWTPETENKVMSRIHPRDISRDISLLKKYIHI